MDNAELSSFDRLISPLSAQEFFADYWEERPLVLADPKIDRYERCLSLREVDYLLSSLAIETETSFVKFIQNKKELRMKEYLNHTGAFLDMMRVMKGFREGATIVLNYLQRRFEPLQKFCHSLEELFGHFVHANAYLTPSNAQGFEAHYDPHDVFILQMEGEKLWKIYDRVIPYPIDRKEVPYERALGPPQQEIVLKPGALLYIPRGYIHEALTTDRYSLHVTVGIRALTWVDLIHEMAIQEPSLRKALPKNFLDKEKNASFPLDSILPVLAKREIMEKAVDKLHSRWSEAKTPSFHPYLSLYSEAEKITEETNLKKEGDWSIEIQDNQTLLQCRGASVSTPWHLFPLLEYMQKIPSFSIKTIPFEISEEDKWTLVRALMKRGFLAPS